MQWGVANGVVRVRYRDGSEQRCELHPSEPNNGVRWSSIEADPYYDYGSYMPYLASYNNRCQRNGEIPIRLLLKSGKIARYTGDSEGKAGMGSPYIDGGAAILMPFEIDPEKELEAVEIETLSNDVVIGVMGLTVEMQH